MSEPPVEPDPEDLPVPGAWASRAEVRDDWDDAPMDNDRLDRLILAAHHQVVAYAPALAEGDPVPVSYRMAESLQVQTLGKVTGGASDVEGFGPEGYAVRRRPLSADVKALLRPKRGTVIVR